MKPVIQFIQCLLSMPTRRRRSISVLAGILILIVGFSRNSFAAGIPDRAAWDTYQIFITPIQNNAIAGSTVNDVVRVTVVDVTLTPDMTNPATWVTVPNFPLSFTISGTSVSSTPVTNASGYYDYGLASGTVGSADIIILANGQTQVYTFSYIAGPPAVNPPPGSPNPSYFIVTQDNATADGAAQDIVEVHLSNQYGVNEPAGTLVTLTVTTSTKVPTDALLNGTTTITVTVPLGANGTVDIPVTDVTVGSVTIQASTPNVPGPGTLIIGGAGFTQTIHFVNGPPDPAKSYVVVTQDPAVADGVSQDIVTAYLFDAQGRAITDGTNVTFAILSGTTTIVNAAVQPVTAGNVSGQYVSSVVGSAQIQASFVYNGTTYILNDQSNPANNYTTIHFTNGPPDPSKSYIVVTQDPASADGVSQDIVTAYLFDAQGRAITDGTNVTFSILSGTATIVNAAVQPVTTGSVSAQYTSNALGSVQVQGSYVLGGITYYLNDQSNSANNYVTIHYVAGPPVPSAPAAPTGPTSPGNPTGTTGTLLTVVGDGATADGVMEDSVKAHITDALGNPTPGVQVTFTIITGGTPGATANAQFSNGTTTITATTDANGNIDIPITDITMGNVWISAELVLDPGVPIDGSHRVVTFVAGPAVPSAPGAPTGPTSPGNPTGTTGTLLTITQDFSAANGTALDSVNAHITDKFGNAVANQPVVFTITTGGTLAPGVAQIVGNVQTITLMTDANGNIEAGLISPTAGTVSINAYVYGTSIIDGSAQTVTFINKPDVTNPETKLIVIVYEALANGLGTTVVRAHIVDQNGSPLPNQDVTFAIDSGTATILTAQPVTTDANGDCDIQIVSKTPGYVLITATVDGQNITFGSPARVKFAAINIYVPPVFTPNGDGTNDVLKPILVGIAEFHYFNVYNRWGNLIFTTGDPGVGWDGTFRGVPQPVETYLWIAEGVDVAGKKIVQKGMTSLVR